MEKLPFEILNQIHIHLSQKDKLECMRVCRKWKYFIESNSLFHTIRISNNDQLSKLINKTQKEPRQGEKVERLIIDRFEIKHYRPHTIMKLFPNISVFMFGAVVSQYDLSSSKLSTIDSWCKSIRHIEEYREDVHAIRALNSGMCSRLTTLKITDKYKDSAGELINLLVNAPSLKSLVLVFFYLPFEELELLHENVPSLTLLELGGIEISEAQLSSSSIKPALLMTTFNLRLGAFNSINLHQYCCQKYPNLIELPELWIHNSSNKSEELRYKSVVKRFGPSLKSYSFHANEMGNYTFKMLDQYGCQFTRFTLSTYCEYPIIQLALSNQANCITKLSLSYCSEFSTLDWLKNFVVLSNLELLFSGSGNCSIPYVKVNLDDILVHVGNTLKIIVLSRYIVGISSSTENNACYPSLKSINLGCAKLLSGVDKYISKSLPNLRHLEFLECTWQNNSFVLPASDLLTLTFMHCFKSQREGDEWRCGQISVETLCNNEKRGYTARHIPESWCFLGSVAEWQPCMQTPFDVNDSATHPSMISLPFDKFFGQSYLTFVCNSLKNVCFV